MQFQVPQFIEVEDKIFGPLTFKQFVYVGGGLGASYILWRVLPLYVGAPFIVVVGGLAAALAFFQFNGRPFILALEDGFFFLIRSKLYLWNNMRKRGAPPPPQQSASAGQPQGSQIYIPKLSESKLHELAWSLDIKERISAGIVGEEERRLEHLPREPIAPLRTAKDAMRHFAAEQ